MAKLKEKNVCNDLIYGLVCCRSLITATFIHLRQIPLAFSGGKAEPHVSVYANSSC